MNSKKTRLFRILALALVASVGLSACGPQRDIHDQLIIAAREGNLEKARSLIEKGADVNAKEKVTGEGYTAIFHAASYGHTAIVKLLIEKGANVNERPGRNAPIIIAAWGGHTDTIRVLLEAGADPNAKSDTGWTALAEASRKGYLEIARLLIDKGADVNVRLSDGNTPLSWAKSTKNGEMIALLKRAGARD